MLKPNRTAGRYSEQHVDELITAAHDIASKLEEAEKFSTLLIYTDFNDPSTARLLERFYPFSLPLALAPVIVADNRPKAQTSAQLNLMMKEIFKAAAKLRDYSKIVSGFTDVHNLTPLLLPTRNFRSQDLDRLLRELYRQIAISNNPKWLVETAIKSFIELNPRRRPPRQEQRCFCDGHLFFQSPGKARHGYFRNSASGAHTPTCLLNARSRIGGAYDYRFHFDCIPTRGNLSSTYDNCHDCPTAPAKPTHLNLAPNDFVI